MRESAPHRTRMPSLPRRSTALPLHCLPLWRQIQRILVAARWGPTPSRRTCTASATRPQSMALCRRPFGNAGTSNLATASRAPHFLHLGHQRPHKLEKGTAWTPHHLVRLDLSPGHRGFALSRRQARKATRPTREAGQIKENSSQAP